MGSVVAGSSCGVKPMKEKTIVAPCLTVNVKLPSKSVMMPLVVPFSTTLAPMTGSFVASTTTPFTVTVCAYPAKAGNSPTSSVNMHFFHKLSFFLSIPIYDLSGFVSNILYAFRGGFVGGEFFTPTNYPWKRVGIH